MKKILLSAILVAVGTALFACSWASKSDAQSPATQDVTVGLPPTQTGAPKYEPTKGKFIDTVTLECSKIPSPAKFVYALPATYFDDDREEYPTVYILNGYSGDHTDYARNFDLPKLATDYNMIIVCPDGRNSWYYDSPVNAKMQMESYIIDELVPFVDDTFRTIIEPESRAVTGLSMGGHGAFWLAGRHPDVFGNIGSMSGGLDIKTHPRNGWEVDRALGTYQKNQKRWADCSAVTLVDSMKPGQYNIIFDCGTEDFFIKDNRAMDAALTKRGIKHTFTTRPGKHSWAYWKKSLPVHLKFFHDHFEKAARE